MASKILLKKSTTASAVPTTSDVDVGEVAVNTEDKRLFTQDNGGSVVELGTTPSSVAVTGNATVGGTLGVTGNTTLSGTLGVTGTSTLGTANVTTATVSSKLTVPAPVDNTDAATKLYVDTEVSDAVADLVDSAPATLDTLNELAAAINDNADFATTISTTIGTKLPKDGSEAMSGNLDLGTNKVVNVVDPTSAQDAATKTYVDTADALKLSLTGGTMSGAIAMGTNKITGLGTPTADADASTKAYVDSFVSDVTDLAQSVADAEAAQTAAETAQTAAETAETNAETAQTAAEAAQTAAETAYDNFDDRYLGAKATAPALDNDGDALVTGAIYFDTSVGSMYVYDGASWGTVAPTATSVTVSQVSDLTATAAELNTLDGYTGAVADLNRLDITTEGTSEASKVLTADSSGNVNITSGYLLTSTPIYTTASFYGDVDALTSSSGTLTIPFNAANTFTHTLTENTTIAVSGVAAGYVSTAVLYVVQDASASGYTLSFPSGTRFVGATAPTLTATASAVDVLVLHYHNSTLHVYVAGQDVKA